VYCDERLDCSAPGLTVETLRLRPGYWRTGNRSLALVSCPNHYCVGGTAQSGYCLSQHRGPLCEGCGPGYARSALGGCTPCDKGATIASPIISGVFVLLVLAAAVVVLLRRARDLERDITRKLEAVKALQEANDYAMVLASAVTRIKILIVHFQISLVLPDLMSVRLSPELARWLGVMRVVNLDVMDLLRLGCFVRRDFYVDLLFFSLAPVVLGISGVGVWVAYTRRLAYRPLEPRAREHKAGRANDVLVPFLLGLSFFTYGWVSYIIFQTFICQPFDDGRLLLVSDYR
jgi:hypothetical protein